MSMTRYLMKQKMFCFGEDFAIKDADGREAFYVDGKVLSIGDKLVFKDAAGEELAMIREKLLSFGPTYQIYRGGKLFATVKKKLFTLFRCKFSVDVPGPDDYEAQGSFVDHDYTFERGGRTVATVSKKWFRLTDTYGIEIDDDEDHVLLLASAVVIDLCCHPDDEES